MGLVQLPGIDDCWASIGIFNNPWFRSVLLRKRFRQISKYFHCVNNENTPSRDDPDYKLFKIKPLIDHLNSTFSKYYTPSQNLAIDEQMIGTKSRISFIPYIPKKKKKIGLKVWVLAESLTGYVLQFQIYTGKVKNVVERLGYRVVFDLIKDYLHKGYRIFFDNFYTSVQLVEDLEKQDKFSCGTVRADRNKLPSDFSSVKLAKGEAKFWKSGNITAVTWQDKRQVHLLSSFHSNDMVEIPPRRGEDQSICIQKPKMIDEYNKFMNGVDKCDQLLHYYNIL